jgi:hypothetical protein
MAKDNFALGLGVVAGLGYLFTQIKDKTQTHDAELVYRKYKGRKGPAISATSVKRGTRRRGNDGNMWEVRKSGKSQRWFKGAESFGADELDKSKVVYDDKGNRTCECDDDRIVDDCCVIDWRFMTQDNLHNAISNLSRIGYLEFCAEFDIGGEDAQEMSWFISESYRDSEVWEWLEENGNKSNTEWAEELGAESFGAEDNYKLGNYADYEILELDTHSYLMSVGHSESEAEDLIERYEAFIEVGFENGDSPYEIGISITENERLDNEAESFEAGEWGHGHGLSNIGIESCRKRLAIAEYVLSMSDAVQFYNDTLLQELGIDRYADDFEAEKKNCGCGQDPCVTYGAEMGAESFEAEGCDHAWAITCSKCETKLRDLGDEI